MTEEGGLHVWKGIGVPLPLVTSVYALSMESTGDLRSDAGGLEEGNRCLSGKVL